MSGKVNGIVSPDFHPDFHRIFTLVAVTIIHKHGLSLSFVRFVKKALPFALMQIGLAVGYLLLLQ